MGTEISSDQKEHKPWQFQPGKSGNPGGRPSASKKMRELAQAQGDKCIEFLVSVVNNPAEKTVDRIAAAKDILDRGFGKATQPVSGSDDPDKPPLLIERVIVDPKESA